MTERLEMDEAAFRRDERFAAYELGEALLAANLALQARFGLRAEEFQVLLVVILATVQRHVRTAAGETAFLDRRPLPEELRGSTSRRRIAETLGVPFETVRRHVGRLKLRGLIVEPQRGRLATSGGTLAFLGETDAPLAVARSFLRVVQGLIRRGAVVTRPASATT
jgi:CRP-like cAMP-binding protein